MLKNTQRDSRYNTQYDLGEVKKWQIALQFMLNGLITKKSQYNLQKNNQSAKNTSSFFNCQNTGSMYNITTDLILAFSCILFFIVYQFDNEGLNTDIK